QAFIPHAENARGINTTRLGATNGRHMEENKFFRNIWRINGLILLVAGILAIGVLTFAGYKLYGETTHDRSARNIVNIQEGSEIKEKWHLGYMTDIQGTSYVMVPLNSDQSYAQSYYSKSASSARNYLFIDSKNNDQHWLFKNNEQLIADKTMLSEHGYGNEERNVRAILYQVIKKDTDKDSRLTSKDLKTISISHSNGSGYKELTQGVDIFVGQHTVDENTLLIVYQKQGVGYSANVSLSNLALSNEQKLPKVGP
ncbi:MAG: hypothetical protein KME37_18960, partial [Candidatus Thiodiazotropha sp. (ex Codakia orbicularis)]|nr:hypothetical protein [Candidatus Thiodiazotropha sp. (ex Codakia orbicularis)]